MRTSYEKKPCSHKLFLSSAGPIDEEDTVPLLEKSPTHTNETDGAVKRESPTECCACDVAKYEVTFIGNWSRDSHPNQFPPRDSGGSELTAPIWWRLASKSGNPSSISRDSRANH